MNEKRSEEFEIDLLELAQVLLQKIWLIILVTIIGGAIVFGYTVALIKPEYTASTLLYVNNSNISVGSASFSISNADLSAAQKLVDTYVVILKSRRVLNEVIEESGTGYDYTELSERISAASVNNTEVFRITVTTNSPQESEKIANVIARVLPDKIAEIVNGSDVKIVDYAVIPSTRSAPSYLKNTAIGALAGFVLVCAVIVINYLLDDSIHTEDYLTENYPEIPLLAVIPDLIDNKNSGYGYYHKSSKSAKAKNDKDGRSKKNG
ncbi:MAG: hypothetical protein IJ757_07630 [Clostridiales bacterium]|nr:hypothetical protein [Clostridiales bacterium]